MLNRGPRRGEDPKQWYSSVPQPVGGGRLNIREGMRSRSVMMKSRQQAVVVAQVILPIYPSTALICFREQRAISGWRAQ